MLLDALFRSNPLENPATPVTGESAEEAGFFKSDVFVSPETAMKLGAVYACIYVLSSTLAQMPLHVMRKTGNTVEVARDHPVFYLVHDEPNVWQTSYKWRELKERHVLGWGNGFTKVVRSRRGEIVSLEACMPWETTLLNTGGRYTYGVYNDQGTFAVSPDDMIHIRALGNNQKMGLSPILQHAETIGMGMSGQKYTSNFFGGNARPAGIVSVKGQSLDAKAWVRLKSVWQKASAALRNEENKTMLLPAELDYKALTVSPVDAQIIDMLKLNRSQIAGIFNIPAHMINDLEKATFSNITQQSIQFVRHTVMPWIVNWEQELNRRLFTRAERAAGYYVRFNLAGLLRGTPQERANFYHFAITDGWMSRNEARAFEDMNPVDGLDEMLVSVNAAKLTTSNTDIDPNDKGSSNE
ncbi:phage portal protein [Yersinia enterocolitica]|uniref:phage portal protein n=1 Tax=Yersinia enterocolitica TaxID=630 RepID=UPI001C8D3E83|nr:phage portal protein [Yersinia enterocolitica]MBX9498533.1 phage portal protein [Yersinia enterocolitica]